MVGGGTSWFGRLKRGVILASLGLMAVARPAHALTINATYVGMTTADISTIQSAINFYESTFTNPISVAIQFDAISTGLGETSQYIYSLPYTGFLNSLQTDTNPVAQAALTTLPNTTTDPVIGQTNIYVSGANGRALGYTTAPGSTLTTAGLCTSYQGDACVGLNTGITTTGNGASTGAYSLQAVTQHEIDEVLGLGSALSAGNPTPTFVRPEDLYRYSGSGVRSFSTNACTSSTQINYVPPSAYLSLNGGVTNLANFNNCNNGADYGDWAGTAGFAQVQDAYATPNTTPLLTTSSPEVLALQAIGYTVQVPEPMSVALLATGLVGIAAVRRRRARIR